MWVKDIQKLANLTNRSFPESAAEEIHFWSSIGEALEMTSTELRCRCSFCIPSVAVLCCVWHRKASTAAGRSVRCAGALRMLAAFLQRCRVHVASRWNNPPLVFKCRHTSPASLSLRKFPENFPNLPHSVAARVQVSQRPSPHAPLAAEPRFPPIWSCSDVVTAVVMFALSFANQPRSPCS